MMVMNTTEATRDAVSAAMAEAMDQGDWWWDRTLALLVEAGVRLYHCLHCHALHPLRDSAYCSQGCETAYQQRYSRAFGRAAA